MAFDPKRHVIKIRGGAEYLPVSARLIWFREEHPDWGIVTEIIEINNDEKYAIFRATIFNEEGRVIASATKKEDIKGFGDYIEKAETGSVGRALAMCGYGAQFEPDLASGNSNSAPRREYGPPREFNERPAPPPMREPMREPLREQGRPAPSMQQPMQSPMQQGPPPQQSRPMPPANSAPAQRPAPAMQPPPQQSRPAPAPMSNGSNRSNLDDEDFPPPPEDPMSIPGIRRGNEIPRPAPRPVAPANAPANAAPPPATRPVSAGAPVQRVREPEQDFADPGGDDDDDFDPFLDEDAPPAPRGGVAAKPPLAKPAPARKPAPDSLL
jgi:hypothetical protein